MFASSGRKIWHWHNGVKKQLSSFYNTFHTIYLLWLKFYEFTLLTQNHISGWRLFSIIPIITLSSITVFRLVSGFGLSEVVGRRILTNTLKYVRLPVVEQDTCSASLTLQKTLKKNVPVLTDNMFCAGFPEGGMDSCQGDSGGPFTLNDNGRFWAAGIVSWGIECGKEGTYGVYTKTTNYLDWINKIMQEN